MQKDKILHLVISFSLTLVAYFITQSILLAGLIVFVIGLGKEILDKKIEKGDILANTIGICLAILVLKIL